MRANASERSAIPPRRSRSASATGPAPSARPWPSTARDLPTWVKLSPADPLTGYANADCIEQLGKDELGEYLGALSLASMRGVNQALAIALALT
jgi:mRNA-degrading endonuclease toxin of MazEF toxin-antitoxin module